MLRTCSLVRGAGMKLNGDGTDRERRKKGRNRAPESSEYGAGEGGLSEVMWLQRGLSLA